MAKPSIYRVSQKRHAVITDTIGPGVTLDGHVKQRGRIWQAMACSNSAANSSLGDASNQVNEEVLSSTVEQISKLARKHS
ncbi:MAG: hypothetical protein ACI8P0_004122 [Planctomycetaceae bacterium]|jgi:hypothetical protein